MNVFRKTVKKSLSIALSAALTLALAPVFTISASDGGGAAAPAYASGSRPYVSSAMPNEAPAVTSAAGTVNTAPSAAVSASDSGQTTFAEAFPDDNFRSYVINTFFPGTSAGSPFDSSVVINALKSTLVLNVSNLGIANLKGIEYFKGLNNLNCSHNLLTSLNVQQNPVLQIIQCSYNLLTSLNLPSSMGSRAQYDTIFLGCRNNNIPEPTYVTGTGFLNINLKDNYTLMDTTLRNDPDSQMDYYFYPQNLQSAVTPSPDNEYTVYFDGNGRTGYMPPQTFTDQQQTINPNTFAMDGAKFAGWAIKQTDQNILYHDGDPIGEPNLATLSDGSDGGLKFALYAVWEPDTANLVPPTITESGLDGIGSKGLLITIESIYNLPIRYSVEDFVIHRDYYPLDPNNPDPDKYNVDYVQQKPYNGAFKINYNYGDPVGPRYLVKAYIDIPLPDGSTRTISNSAEVKFNGKYNLISSDDLDTFIGSFNPHLSPDKINDMLYNVGTYQGDCGDNNSGQYYVMSTYYATYDMGGGVSFPALMSRFMVFTLTVDPDPGTGPANDQLYITAKFQIVHQRGLALAKDSRIITAVDPNHLDLILDVTKNAEGVDIIDKDAKITIYQIASDIIDAANLGKNLVDATNPLGFASALKSLIDAIKGAAEKPTTKDSYSSNDFSAFYWDPGKQQQDPPVLSPRANILLTRQSSITAGGTLSVDDTYKRALLLLKAQIVYPSDSFYQVKNNSNMATEYEASRTVSTVSDMNFVFINLYPVNDPVTGFALVEDIKECKESTIHIVAPWNTTFKWVSDVETRGTIVSYPDTTLIGKGTYVNMTTPDNVKELLIKDQDGDTVATIVLSSETPTSTPTPTGTSAAASFIGANLNLQGLALPETISVDEATDGGSANWKLMITLNKLGMQTLHVYDQNNMNDELMSFNIYVYDGDIDSAPFAVTVVGGMGGGYYAPNAAVNISAGMPPEGQRFKNWTSVPDVAFADANSENTSFAMISGPVKVIANFEPIGPDEFVRFKYGDDPAMGIEPGKNLDVEASYISDDTPEAMYIALYSGDGKLINVSMASGVISDGNISFSAGLEIPDGTPDNAYIKVFFWNPSTYAPVRDAVLFPDNTGGSAS